MVISHPELLETPSVNVAQHECLLQDANSHCSDRLSTPAFWQARSPGVREAPDDHSRLRFRNIISSPGLLFVLFSLFVMLRKILKINL